MCNAACIDFVARVVVQSDVEGKRILEVGAMDVNGSARQVITRFRPTSYVGVDIQPGPGVDELCNANDLVDRFGQSSVDVVIATELIEHVREWRRVIGSLLDVLRPDGVLVITTRSLGYPFHGAPFDFWRYEPEDIEAIFRDMVVERLERDPLMPGVFAKVRKPCDLHAVRLPEISLYSMISERRVRRTTQVRFLIHRIRHLSIRRDKILTLGKETLPPPFRRWLKRKLGRAAK
ncbi:MAG: class I SAM-dependent methyltransferase [Gammaproteobacteria bacterium]